MGGVLESWRAVQVNISSIIDYHPGERRELSSRAGYAR